MATNLNIAPVRSLSEVPHQVINYITAAGEAAEMYAAGGVLDTYSTEFVKFYAAGEVDAETGKVSKAKAEFYGFFTPRGAEEHVKIRVWAFDQELIDELKAAQDNRQRLIFSIKAARLVPYSDEDEEGRLSMTLVHKVGDKLFTEIAERLQISSSTYKKELLKAFG